VVETARLRALRELAALKQQQLQRARQTTRALEQAVDLQEQAAAASARRDTEVLI
jgi:hypothetical protein